MKLGIVSTVNQKHMTLISHYTEILDFHNIEYDLIYFDRYDEEEKYTNAEKQYKYNVKINKNWSFPRKVIEYFKGRSFFIKNIKSNNYDYLIIWNTFTGIMLLDFLILSYKKKYFLNIRDYSFEKNYILFNLTKILIKGSKFTTISSEGFKSFLPPFNYLMLHSFNNKILTKKVNSFTKKDSELPLRITFIGNVRFYNQNKRILLKLKNDQRFIMQYFGTNSEILKEFTEKNNIKNVEFLDSFDPFETESLLLKTDILNNFYGNKDIALDTAISIRLYYSAFMKIPILTSPETYMSEMVTLANLGFDIDINSSNLGDLIFENYHTLDVNKFSNGANTFMKKVTSDNFLFKKKLTEIIMEKNGE
ncbi:capsular biosynthesis protein [Planomicrobium sp. Y74]|uniref:capsular biosynthesis protein n=1 Tax=Planomicrobium sp. Y74 TaxID=2478977 RepID=UPI000EF4BB23|nr:capsular biosynthesis protein [Planomicrobium sp. Y74]RLQ86715.1 capsular biosynthesis protein [Planomicrobium sp. Y74]